MSETENTPAPTPAPVPSRLGRLLRSRVTRTAVVAGVVGALLGAGTVAWRTDTLPLVSLGPAPCWDSFDEGTMKGLFGDRETEVQEQTLQADPLGPGLSYGQCRITSFKDDRAARRVTVRVHQLDGLRGTDARQWPSEFLAAGMVALGEGLPGMTSGSRAWLALPESCTGPVDEFDAATVVDVATGSPGLNALDSDEEQRTALTRAVVAATNGVMRDFGCSGTYRMPDRIPEIVDRQDFKADPFCGIKGLALPAPYRKGLTWSRVGGGDDGPVRVCEAGYKSLDGHVRLTTVVDPRLTEVFSQDVLRGGTGVKGTKGYGSVTETRAVYEARCQTGPVVFIVEQERAYDGQGYTFTREVLPAYVAAEAERIGCGPEKVTMSKG